MPPDDTPDTELTVEENVPIYGRWLPRHQSIELPRNPALGIPSWRVLVAAGYLAAMGLICLRVATHRLSRKPTS